MAQTKTIEELRDVWETNKDGFQAHELGKLQDFIKDIFESGQLFALKYGDIRRDNGKRKNEFTRETATDDGTGRGRADIIVFIDGEDVVIPVEVERLGNIKAGESQLLRYQTEWRKKYGILTDGYEWRLYFDRWYETFHLEDIFDKKSRFWNRWKLYVSPETYYDLVFNAPGRQELFEAGRLDPCAAENRPFFLNDITTLLRAFKSKITERFPLLAEQDEKTAVETTYSYVIQFILYKVLIDNNYKKLKNEYEVFREYVKIATRTKKYDGIITDIQRISEYIYKNVYEPFRKEQEDINKFLIKQLKRTTTLAEVAPWLDIIMFIDRYDFADVRNEIFGFVYENYLKELYHDENKGQYFTDPAVVNFMLEELGYTKDALKKTGGENISIIDPSCGAGTFLYSATVAIKEAFDDGTKESSKKIERLVNENVYGLDIEEFPLFLAEMNILMQLLPVVVNSKYSNVIQEKLKLFITKDSIAEFLGSAINALPEAQREEVDLFAGFDVSNSPPYMRDGKDLVELYESLEGGLNHRKRFDYVIGNPPYVGYNRCGHMEFAKRIKDENNTTLKMNNVYGMNLHTVKGRRKPYPPKPNLYAFFIALGLGLLKDNGKICYIIPQTILSAGDLDVLRYHLSRYTSIEKIITFEGNLFIGRGLKQSKPVSTSSLIFVAKKSKPQSNHTVKIVNYKPYTDKQGKNFGAYFNSRNKEVRKIRQSELVDNIDNWTFIKQDAAFLQARATYETNSMSIEDWRRDVLKDYDGFCFDVGFILDQRHRTSDSHNNYPILDFKQSLGYTKMFFNAYYPKTRNKIKLTRNSRYATLDHKYNIVCRIKNFQKFMLIEEPVIFNMGQASIIATDDKEEALYIFAILNAPLNIKMLESSFKTENEKDFLVSIKSIKRCVRVPKITPKNAPIKKEIIRQAESMLDLEKPTLGDIVDFPATHMQTFDNISVENYNTLVLSAGNKKFTAKIKRGKADLVKTAVEREFFAEASRFPKKEINFGELRLLPVIDFAEQSRIKAYIDDLVFALYFNMPVKNLCIENAAVIHKSVAKHEFFSIVNVADDK